ncbi:hypothetical protein NG54_13565 [Heyndrickxia ginsengihumi]|uniref:Uncharacterized protein n=1 Tax=Heyndrickxia ginsengihumi TaxID=363870 RepID=A0A0A6VAW1_9BACI|nr:hypothetical protein NG54_13565 [Heyndrickxia ginsengihumi]
MITGNGLQALGALISLTDEFNDRTQSGRNYNIIGNALQSIGNSMQAVSGIYDLQENKGEDAEILDILGSWIQAVGSIFSLVGQVLEERDEAEKHQPE